MPEQKELIKNLEENQRIVLQLQKNLEQLKLALSEKVLKEDERSVLLNKAMAENVDLRAESEIKNKELIDKEAELNVLRTKLTPVLEENRNLARANANFMKELSVLKQQLEENEKQLHEKGSHFNLLIENIRNETQRKLKDAIDLDANTIIELRNEIERLNAEIEKRDAVLREREAKEKELMVDVVNRFKEMLSSETAQQGNGGMKELLPLVDSAIRKGDDMNKIKSSLSKKGYSESSIEKAVVMLKKGI